MKILLTGKDGQVGFALHKKLAYLGEVIATNRDILDLTDSQAIKKFIDKTKPNIIINPAAYTKVDKAEIEPILAYKINAIAPLILAEKASEYNIPIIHFSTNYVFDGLKNEPYVETDKVNPQSVYGQTKWEGEEAVRQYKKHMVIRTGWVFSQHGQNFLKMILQQIQEKSSLSIVSDQKGTPTSADLLANITCHIIKSIRDNLDFDNFGTYHVTSYGETDWHDYACFIIKEAIRLGFRTSMTSLDINPILSKDYPIFAKRPLNNRLCTNKIRKTSMLKLPHWQEEVVSTLKNLPSQIE